MTTPDTLLGAVADAIATADVDGATYEDLAWAALVALKIPKLPEESGNNDQEDDGA